MTLSEQPPTGDATSVAFGQLVGAGRTGGLGWWWHTTEDTIDRVDPDLLLRDARIYLVGVARLLCSKLLPLNAAAEARELLDDLRRLQDECGDGFDLSPAIERARELVRKTERLDAWAQVQGEHADDRRCALYNGLVMGVIRSLLPINYTASGAFEHDPALTMPRLPLLSATSELGALPPDSDDARFLRVRLVRARNQVVYALERALEEMRLVDELEGDSE
jgi:hypothetical protein